jgi:5-methylcytosine-specific restriction endonuclease McrA
MGGKGSGRPLGSSTKQTLEMRHAALLLRLKGLSYREIGEVLGTSRQYAQQITSPPPYVYASVRARAKLRCEECGIKIESGHVHHKTRKADNVETYNGMANLEYLCISCHMQRHAGDVVRVTKPASTWNKLPRVPIPTIKL